MKKTISFKSLIVLFSIVSFISCEIEPLDSAIDLDALNQNNSNNPNENGSTGGVSTGDYWPTALNNQWVLERDGVTQQPLKIIGTETFNTKLYYKFEEVTDGTGGNSVTAYSFLNKNNGDYTYKVDNTTLDIGGLTGTQTGFEYIILKDYLDVNGTWSGSYTQTTTYTGIPPIVLTVNYQGTILEKNATLTVPSGNYSNVIKCRIVLNVSNQGTTSTTTTDYWYAKDVGPIKSVTTSGGTTTTSDLISYILN
ncbi:hypothetical protein FLGE108171_02050 [Flavobacterium gelidilacus]|uniref:hypothetical protein n=1 Tax=Flavobacterium gelidilacus TaxID=206041 RepID=UPI000422EB67|nr:hypothetical protein [Flavobacterium gelidilacus]